MKNFLRNNGLTLVVGGLFLIFLIGSILTGHAAHIETQQEHHERAIGLQQYITSGHFLMNTFSNWESEYFHMVLLTLLTAWFMQKGSAESNDLEEEGHEHDNPKEPRDGAPEILAHGDFARFIYSYSLTIALLVLFALFWILHFYTSLAKQNQTQIEHGKMPMSAGQYIGDPTFWFETFSNWQGEFFGVVGLLILSIYFRTRGSQQSKKVTAPHDKTGS